MQPTERQTYAITLRAIGAYLDEHGAQMATVIEVNLGFALRFQQRIGDPTATVVRFQQDDLAAFQTELEWRRSPVRRSAKGDGSIAGTGGYQDFFRALGYELDGLEAWDIVVDELVDGILVTYLHLDPEVGYMARKNMIRLDVHQMQHMLESAYGRRSIDPRVLARTGPPAPLPPMNWREGHGLVGRARWELGERQIFRTELKNLWSGASRRDLGRAELVVTNRRLVLRTSDGTTQSVSLDGVHELRADVRRDLLTRHFRVVVQGDGTDIGLDTPDQTEMDRLLDVIKQGLDRTR